MADLRGPLADDSIVTVFTDADRQDRRSGVLHW